MLQIFQLLITTASLSRRRLKLTATGKHTPEIFMDITSKHMTGRPISRPLWPPTLYRYLVNEIQMPSINTSKRCLINLTRPWQQQFNIVVLSRSHIDFFSVALVVVILDSHNHNFKCPPPLDIQHVWGVTQNIYICVCV